MISIPQTLKMQGKKYFLQRLSRFFLVVFILPGHFVYGQEDGNNLAAKWQGYVTGDFRYFPADALYANQKNTYFSLAAKPQFNLAWNKSKSQLIFTGFARLDQ